MFGNTRRFGLGIVVGLVLLMSIFCVRVIPTSVDAAITPQWTLKTPLNETLSESVIVQDEEGLVYICGGMNTVTYGMVNNVSTYDLETGQWKDLADMPQATRGAAGAYLDGKVYVFGGYDSAVGWLDDTQIYDVSSNSWSSGTPVPLRLWQSKAGVGSNGLIYVFGGKDPTYSFRNTVYVYNPVSDGWSTGTNMLVGTSGGAVVSYGYSIFYIGGQTSMGATGAVYVYYTGGSWDTLASLPRPTVGLAAVLGADGLLYSFGGAGWESEIGLGYNWTYVYDVWNDAWYDGPNMTNMPRYLGGAVTSEGQVFALGGANGMGPISAVSSMRVMSVSASVDPAVVLTGRPVMVTVVTDFAFTVPSHYSVDAVLRSASGTSYGTNSFDGPLSGTFAFEIFTPVGAPAGAYTVDLTYIGIEYENGGNQVLPDMSLPLDVIVGETLDEQIQSLLDEIAALEAALSASDAKLTAMAIQVGIMQAKLDGIVAGLAAMGAGQAAAMADLNETLANLQSQLDAFQVQIDRVENKADTAGTYGLVTLILVIVVILLVAMMVMMARKKP